MTVAQLKQKWKDLQKTAKDLLKRMREASIATGGGDYEEIKVDPISEEVLSLIGEQIAPISNIFDSDRIFDEVAIAKDKPLKKAPSVTPKLRKLIQLLL